MIEQFGIEADDRILVLALAEPELIRQLAAAASRGGIACLGERDVVYEARRAFRDLRNVMCHPGPPDDIPFEDGFFTKVLDTVGRHDQPAVVAGEVARVLAGGGRAYLAGACRSR